MTHFKKLFSLTFFAVLILAACNKVADLPVYADGAAPVVTASKTAISPAISDSNKTVLTLNWTGAKYANVDSTTKYLVQVDSAGGSFAKPYTKEVIGKLTTSFTGNELNNTLLNYGSTPGAPSRLLIRVVSSYSNNNERHNSNTVNVDVTVFAEPSTLTTTATTVAGTIATADQMALTFNWTAAFKSYNGAVSYSIEYDSASKNFASPVSVAVDAGSFSKALTNQEVNAAAIAKGIAPATTGSLEYRVKAMTALGAIVYSNTVTIMVTTFDPIAVTPPASGQLFIVGGATPNGWGNPTSTPTQELVKIDQYTFGAILQLTAGQSYLFLPVNGSWTVKYGGLGANNTNNPMGDGFKENGGDLMAPATSGLYKIIVNFKTGLFSLTPVSNAVPTELYITGSAVPSSWTNTPPASQKFTQLNNGEFEITMPFTSGNQYKFLSSQGNWQPQFGGSSDTGGTLGANWGGGNDPDAVPTPAVAGIYKIHVDFVTMTYTVTKI